MFTRIALAYLMIFCAASIARAQVLRPPSSAASSTAAPAPAASASSAAETEKPAKRSFLDRWRGASKPTSSSASSGKGRGAAKITSGQGVLPNRNGQVWREYDITPYTSRVSSTTKPEQAVVDWILRETGTEVWFSEPLGLLSATKQKLYVYHTPQMQQIVSDVVDRFVASEAESHVLGLRLVTLGNPNWRSKAYRLMQPVDVKATGIEAWLMSKENAALLLGQLRKRTDFREHNSPNLLIHNGQSQTITRTRPRGYVRSVRMRAGSWPGYGLENGQVHEGYSLQISPLFSTDKRMIDAVIKCHIDQVERLVPVSVETATSAGQPQRVQIQVPQMVSWRLHERFRWPSDQVLLLSCGIVATPGPDRPTMLGIPNPLAAGPGRADALLFIESKGKESQALLETDRTARGGSGATRYRGRY